MDTHGMTPDEIYKLKKEWYRVTKVLKESGLDLSKIQIVLDNPEPKYLYREKGRG